MTENTAIFRKILYIKNVFFIVIIEMASLSVIILMWARPTFFYRRISK